MWVNPTIEQYKNALAINPYSATLIDATEINMYNSLNAIRVYKMADVEVYFSLIESYDNSIDLSGLINNCSVCRGYARKYAIPYAIQQGANSLNCWNIQGFLPNLYAQFGFKIYDIVGYDSATYGEPSKELRNAWKLSGWNENTVYPSVVYMLATIGTSRISSSHSQKGEK